MFSSIVAKRYARALFELSCELDIVPKLMDDFNCFIDVIGFEVSIESFITTPLVSFLEKKKFFELIAKKGEFCDLLCNFSLMIIEKKRATLIKDIFQYLKYLVKESQGVVEADVVVAGSISDINLGAVKDVLKSLSGYNVDLNLSVDSLIIGGFIAKIKNNLVDMSISGYLNDMEKRLIS